MGLSYLFSSYPLYLLDSLCGYLCEMEKRENHKIRPTLFILFCARSKTIQQIDLSELFILMDTFICEQLRYVSGFYLSITPTKLKHFSLNCTKRGWKISKQFASGHFCCREVKFFWEHEEEKYDFYPSRLNLLQSYDELL
jgi:hypothetical protein